MSCVVILILRAQCNELCYFNTQSPVQMSCFPNQPHLLNKYQVNTGSQISMESGLAYLFHIK